MPRNPHEVCRALRAYRIRARIKQQVIAKALGVTQSQVSRWESGRDQPRPHNVEAIESLVYGPGNTLPHALVHFVAGSRLPVVLFDKSYAIRAISPALDRAGGPLARFGWVFDPAANPAIADIYRQCRRILADPGGVVGLQVRIPFVHEGANLVANIRKTIYPTPDGGLCLAEIAFEAASAHPGLRAPRLDKVSQAATPEAADGIVPA